jgi:uncharacterized membrane protein
MRTAVLGCALAFTMLLGFLTVYVLLSSGPDVLTLVSLLVLALLVFGIFGAFSAPPDRRR